jgi:hypothetical protein
MREPVVDSQYQAAKPVAKRHKKRWDETKGGDKQGAEQGLLFLTPPERF